MKLIPINRSFKECKTDILACANSIISGPCIYFLLDYLDIVYVGQSVCPLSRIEAHKESKTFTSFSLLPCEREDLSNLEAFYILEYRPEYNQTFPNNDLYAPLGGIQQTMKHLKVSGWEFVSKKRQLGWIKQTGIKPFIKTEQWGDVWHKPAIIEALLKLEVSQ